ncbi:tetratricopeptide repeat protein [Stenomitos frigidus]|uniref:tetratricopeptide repeat protein n=1 Tax=Stenomitos frigidus TaxID=1886765 RepID=UPI0015E73382|nr:tetratricopeptide repeat protein [Stenomitos frigidus]
MAKNFSASTIALLVIIAPVISPAADDRPLERSPLPETTSSSPAVIPLTEPQTPIDFVKRGVAKSSKKDFEGAIADFNQAITLKRDYAPAYYNRGYAYVQTNNRRAAIADYSQVILLKPNNAYVRYERGVLRVEAGEKEGAIEDFQQAATLFKQQLNGKWQDRALNQLQQLQQS